MSVKLFSMEFYSMEISEGVTMLYKTPDKINRKTRLLIVIPGVKRDADNYLKNWSRESNKENIVVASLKFATEQFKGSQGYNQGNLLDVEGRPNRYENTVFGIIDRTYIIAKKKFNLGINGFYLFGHSAGAQIVHRYVLFSKSDKLIKAAAANAGWYTYPVDIEYPYGIKGVSVNGCSPVKTFNRRLGILLGNRDTDENHKYLNRSTEVMKQGKNRFERGERFYRESLRISRQKGLKLQWSMVVVNGVGHNGRKMIPSAINYLFRD